jgi:RTX calcium-binding nonapeptide repeat (4 copies)
MNRCLAPGLAAAALFCLASAADAAVVSVQPQRGVYGDEVVFAAAAGEVNSVLLRYTADDSDPSRPTAYWTAVDTDSPLVAGDSCQAIDVHAVRCQQRPASTARVELGDLDDRLTVEANSETEVVADGGAGRDHLTGIDGGYGFDGGPGDDQLATYGFGGPAPVGNFLDGGPGNDSVRGGRGDDRLRGGGGSDELDGGAGDDTMLDDDIDGAAGDAAPGQDWFDGGPGFDTVDYHRRSAPISVDLAASKGPDRDSLARLESAIGGRGNDRLAGDDRHNVLDGRGGRDQLMGRGGADELHGAAGLVFCGRGRDTYFGGRSSRDFLQPDCEVLALGDSEDQLNANPVAASATLVRFRLTCPTGFDGENEFRERCAPALRLGEARGKRRTLARGKLPLRAWTRHMLTARLTPLGRRLATRPHGVRARVRVAGFYGGHRTLRWSIRLKVRAGGSH